MAKGTVLVVDDDQDILDIVVWVLEDEGYTVLTARDGALGLKVAHAEHVDLVLMDLVMPVMDGVEAIRQLRASPATQAIPVVAMSTRDKVVHTGELGVNGRLIKPFETQHLLRMVEHWMPRPA